MQTLPVRVTCLHVCSLTYRHHKRHARSLHHTSPTAWAVVDIQDVGFLPFPVVRLFSLFRC